MFQLYSHWGIPNKFQYTGDKKTLLCIDPPPNYFGNSLNIDRNQFDRIILIHGCEPPLINNIKNEIITYEKFFDKIYSFDIDVLTNCKNSEIFNFGSCWVLTDKFNNLCDYQSNYVNKINIDEKKFKLSFVKSSKKFLPGHKLRHKLDDVLFGDYNFEFLSLSNIPSKLQLFTDSMFHLCIENSVVENYFTEKIIDCFMTFTIPIYWGCPNITQYFNPEGIIQFETKEELKAILENLNETEYKNKIDTIKENYEIARTKFAFFYDRVNKILNEK